MSITLRNILYHDSIKINLLGNISGKIITSIISVLIVPFYIKIIGIEGYAMIGLFSSITALASMLDLGISTSLNRELAKVSKSIQGQLDSINLIYTMEIIYIFIGIIGFIILYFLVPFFQLWVNPVNLSTDTIRYSFVLICFVFLTQWPITFYVGGLNGFGKQFLSNLLQVLFAIFKTFGTVIVLIYYKPSIEVFFLCNIIANILFFFIFRFAFWSCFPNGNLKAIFNVKSLDQIKSFTSGISLLMILSLILTQSDKIIVSKFLSLEMFGYYSLALVVSSNLGILVNAAYNSFFPRITNLYHTNNNIELIKLYHQGCQLVSLLLFPISLTVLFFSKEILFMWTSNELIVENAYFVLSLLIVGQIFNSLVLMPLLLQFASGWLWLSIVKNIIAIVIYIPLMIYLTTKYSIIGAGISWIILNMSYFLLEVPIMHTRLLVGELYNYYVKDTILPFLLSISVIGISYGILYSHSIVLASRLEIFLFLIFVGITSSIITTMGIKYIRDYIISVCATIRKR